MKEILQNLPFYEPCGFKERPEYMAQVPILDKDCPRGKLRSLASAVSAPFGAAEARLPARDSRARSSSGRERDGARDRDRSSARERDRDAERGRDRDGSKERERGRDRGRDRSSSRAERDRSEPRGGRDPPRDWERKADGPMANWVHPDLLRTPKELKDDRGLDAWFQDPVLKDLCRSRVLCKNGCPRGSDCRYCARWNETFAKLSWSDISASLVAILGITPSEVIYSPKAGRDESAGKAGGRDRSASKGRGRSDSAGDADRSRSRSRDPGSSRRR